MNVDRLILGAYETNSYVLRRDENETQCVIIDTGLEPSPLLQFLEVNNLQPVVLVLTHGHADHIAGVEPLRETYSKISVCIHKDDAQMLTKPQANLSMLTGEYLRTQPADRLLEEGDLVEAAGIKLEVLHTSGHTPGGISLYARKEGLVFVGDALFADSVGRTDFPGGDMNQLIRNIREKICTLPDNTIIHPGHGSRTTVGREKSHNQYLL